MSFLKSILHFYVKKPRVFGVLRVSVLQEPVLNTKYATLLTQHCTVRHKSRKSRGKQNQEEEDSDDSDDEQDLNLGKGTEVKTSVVGSMRADLLLKVGLGIARNKVEEAFYESRIRVNSKKIFKKSAHVQIGDEVDLIKGFSPTNPSFLTVGRLEILSAKERADEEGIAIKMRRTKTLTIENYPDGDPWKQSE